MDDALLVADLNGNGKVDGFHELFGSLVTGDAAGAARDNLNLAGDWIETGAFTSSAVTGTELTFKFYTSAGLQVAVREGLDLVVA